MTIRSVERKDINPKGESTFQVFITNGDSYHVCYDQKQDKITFPVYMEDKFPNLKEKLV